jgi:voltage-gated potassium channel
MKGMKRPDSSSSRHAGYEFFILVLALLSLIPFALYFWLPQMAPATRSAILLLDGVISVIFMADFFRSLARAKDRAVFLKWGWLDFLGSLPTLPLLRIFRLARVVRIVAQWRRRGRRALLQDYLGRRAESTFWTTSLVTVILVVVSSYLILRFESRNAEANIESAGDALWWALVTVTTVGYGDRYPTTDAGRFLATLLILVGVALLGVLTSYLASAFLSREEQEQASELAEIRAELAEIKRLLQEQAPTHTDRHETH